MDAFKLNSNLNRPTLTQETFQKLREFIDSKCGIHFADNKKYLLEKRLLKRIEAKNLKTYEDYLCYLTYDKGKDAEMRFLYNSISTNETSFFRDPVQLDVFRLGVLPGIIEAKKKRGEKSFKIWSAACSTGEEPLTLAMILMEEGLHTLGWTIDIIGSDISGGVISMAEKGEYENYAVRNTPASILKKYFTQVGSVYKINKEVSSLVKYKNINLLNAADTRIVRQRDIVFCRNVLIYFTDATKKKVVNNIYDSLSPGGCLFVGFSESLHNITRLYKPVSIKNSVVYNKM
jgi:chemotaxis protein methyltransferase CheR